jgi:hypothetical protein
MTDSAKRYRITYTVTFELIVDPEFPTERVTTPSFAQQVFAVLRERVEELKAVLPVEVLAWFGTVGGYRMQESEGRALLHDFQLHCEEIPEVSV